MDGEFLDRCRTDPVLFATAVLGVELYDYQAEALRCDSKHVVLRGGRQVGKSFALAVKCLHHAFALPGAEALIVSAGEVSAKYLMSTMQRMVKSSEALADSATDEMRGEIRFSNGSVITSIPASEKQARGRSCSLLILDEARSLTEDLWEASAPVTLARPGSQIWLSSTPGGTVTGFFRRHYAAGMEAPSEWVKSFWWPATISPLVDKKTVEQWRVTWDPVAFRREVLGEDVDDAEVMFGMELVLSCLADWEPFTPADAYRCSPPLADWQLEEGRAGKDLAYDVAAGIDWGTVHDGNVLACVGVLDDQGANGRGHVYFLVHLDARYGTSYDAFIPAVTEAAAGYRFAVMTAENNGVGQYPSTILARRVREQRNGTEARCLPTTGAVKLEMFSKIHGLMTEGRLVLPRDDRIVSQFCGLSREESDAGFTRIAGRRAHDDIPMAIMQAFRGIEPADRPDDEIRATWGPDYEHTRTGRGTMVPQLARPERFHYRSWTRPR